MLLRYQRGHIGVSASSIAAAHALGQVKKTHGSSVSNSSTGAEQSHGGGWLIAVGATATATSSVETIGGGVNDGADDAGLDATQQAANAAITGNLR